MNICLGMSEKTWKCEYCPPSEYGDGRNSNLGSYDVAEGFSTQQEFVNHLEKCHLLVKVTQGGKEYICRYGPLGICACHSNKHISFSNQRDYEHHLVSQHLLRSPPGLKRSSQPPTIPKTFLLNHSNTPHWSVFQSSVNLPAVLNDPSYRQTDIFSRTWGEQFESAEVQLSPKLPVIDENDFTEYLKKLGIRGGILQKNTRFSSSHSGIPSRRSTRSSLSSHTAAITPSDKLQEDLITHHTMDSLNSVPEMFFSSEFSLKQQKTFYRVIPLRPRSNFALADAYPMVNQSSPSAISQAEDFVRQHDRLTQYLDVVELHLANQVSKKSGVFFEAVCTHDVVRDRLNEALTQIKLVRNKLKIVDSSTTHAAMRLHRLVRRKANYRILLEKLKVIAGLQAAQPTIQILLRGNDFCAALELVATTQSLLRSSSDITPSLVNGPAGSDAHQESQTQRQQQQQQQIVCLRHLSAQMVEISRFVRHMIEAEFEAAVRQFLEPRASSDLQYIGPDLVPCLQGLLHTKRYDFVSAFRAELLRQIKLAQVNSSASTNSGTTNSDAPFRERLRTMSNESWIQLIADRCATLKDLLNHAKEAFQIFTVTMSSCLSSNYDLTNDVVSGLTTQLRSTLQTATNMAQKHIADLVSLRNRLTILNASNTGSPQSSVTSDRHYSPNMPQHATNNPSDPSSGDGSVDRLTLEESIRLVNILEVFQDFLIQVITSSQSTSATDVEETDKNEPQTTMSPMPRGSVSILNRLIFSLTRNSIQRFHNERNAKLEVILNQERWQAVPVPTHVQQLVSRHLVGRLQNGIKPDVDSPSLPSLSDCKRNGVPFVTRQSPTGRTISPLPNEVSSCLTLGGERYVVVGTLLFLLPMMMEYVGLANDLPKKSWSVKELTNRLADLLHTFNSRTCQLVLGAEARKAADLPTISARNLALASRSLQLVVRCIPVLEFFFESLIPSDARGDSQTTPAKSLSVPNQLRQENALKQVENLFHEHIGQINDKLFSLLSRRIQDHLNIWQVRPPTPSVELRTICRAFSRMTEMTNDVLPVDVLVPIILRAHNEFKAQLRHRLTQLGITADGGPKQSLIDSELTFYMNQLRCLSPRLSKFTDDFMDVWPDPARFTSAADQG
ncbi:unnamed protein product [Calicophoron daubneyi]|uniref:Vacuolar protein sorting-associated protein 54 n=1 Tax=Calicophoron daubneyi TaxID=300641 RepID=A0AAV2TX11_CALDB